jgi:hypothetical protein
MEFGPGYKAGSETELTITFEYLSIRGSAMPTDLPFVGRKSEMEDLFRLIREGSPIWVFGPTGVGKTYLVENMRRCFVRGEIDEEYVRNLIEKRGYEINTEEWFYYEKGERNPIRCLFAQTGCDQKQAAQAMNKLLTDLETEVEECGLVSRRWRRALKNWQAIYCRIENDGEFHSTAAHALTQQFRKTLAQIAKDDLLIVLVFDEYEQRPLILKTWLQSLMKDRGVLFSESRVVIVAVSQTPLSEIEDSLRRWVEDIEVRPFEYPQDRSVLSSEIWEYMKEVLGEHLADPEEHDPVFIHQLTEGFPQLIKIVADKYMEQGSTPLELREDEEAGRNLRRERRDQVSEVVKNYLLHTWDKRLLSSVRFYYQQELVRFCAVPTEIDADVVKTVNRFMEAQGYHAAELKNRDKSIEWLAEQPFVDRWCYDSGVRVLLLRTLYYRSPDTFENLNQYLRVFFENRARRDGYAAKCWYHMLAAEPRYSLTEVLAQLEMDLDDYDTMWELESALEELARVIEKKDVQTVFRLWSNHFGELRGQIGEAQFLQGLYDRLISFQEELEERFYEREYQKFTKDQMIGYLKKSVIAYLDTEAHEDTPEYKEAYEKAHQRVWRTWHECVQEKTACIDFVEWLFALAEEYQDYAEKFLLVDERFKSQMFQMETELPRIRWQHLEETVEKWKN